MKEAQGDTPIIQAYRPTFSVWAAYGNLAIHLWKE